MPAPSEIIELVLAEVKKARDKVRNSRQKQVTKADLLDHLKAVVYSWFRSHRPLLAMKLPTTAIGLVDEPLQLVLDATSRASAKSTYLAALDSAKHALTNLRTTSLIEQPQQSQYTDAAPDFSTLANDHEMKEILSRRWSECQKCLRAEALLAATVMMGGFLEALLVARANKLQDQAPLYKAKSAPKIPKTNNTRPRSEWMLSSYIDVAFELGWITRPGKDVGSVLREYRNYVHPERERSQGYVLNPQDASMFWDITKRLTVQLLESAKGT